MKHYKQKTYKQKQRIKFIKKALEYIAGSLIVSGYVFFMFWLLFLSPYSWG